MSGSPICTEIERWPLLLGDTVSLDQHVQFEQHLESCSACQEHLDRFREPGGELRRLGRQLGDPTITPPDPQLSQFLNRVHEGKCLDQSLSPEPMDLFFLQPTDRSDLIGTLGDYEVSDILGQGGMGVVLKAFEPALDRPVAIKVLSPALAGSATARRRFSREAHAAAAVCHDHIVPVYGVRETDGLPYLVMQYVAGESLQDQLDRSGPLEVEEVVRIGLQTAMALAAFHDRGLIHRDIKPANILLENAPGETSTGAVRVKITDFGLARMVDDVGLTQNGVLAGTPEYMAPEQARGEPVDHRSDLFSLGSVLYTLCAGVSPFHGATTMAVIHKVCEEEPTPLRFLHPNIPVWLEAFIAHLLAKAPAERFQSTSQVVALLDGFLAHLLQPATVAAPKLPTSAPNSQEIGLPWRWRRILSSPRGLLALWAVVACALGIVNWFAGGADTKSSGGAQEVHLPLRGVIEREGVVLIGPNAKSCVKYEPEGLRITLPAGIVQEHPPTGVRIPVPSHGDFETTIHYEILAEPLEMNAGPRGTRLTLQVQLQRRDWTVAAISRRVSSDKGMQFTTWTIRDNHDNSGKRQMKARQHPAQTNIGRLRIVRTGSEASFYAAEGPDVDYKLLPPPLHLGEEDLKFIELIGATGGASANLDVRFTDLRVKTDLPSPPAEESSQQSKRFIHLILAAVLGVLILGIWLLVRFRRRHPSAPKHTVSRLETDQSPQRIASRSFPCPMCDKRLKVRAELSGRKIKCPGCTQIVRVPESAPGAPAP